MDETFVISPHGQEKLIEFLNHLKGIQYEIYFTMEIAEADHHPFLDIDIYRKMDCFLEYKVYRKPAHTNLNLQHKSHHYPAKQHSVFSSLVHRAKNLCHQESLAPELTFLTNVYKQNCYRPVQINEPYTRPLEPTRKKINLHPHLTYRTPKLHKADSVECWPHTIKKASSYHREKI